MKNNSSFCYNYVPNVSANKLSLELSLLGMYNTLRMQSKYKPSICYIYSFICYKYSSKSYNYTSICYKYNYNRLRFNDLNYLKRFKRIKRKKTTKEKTPQLVIV